MQGTALALQVRNLGLDSAATGRNANQENHERVSVRRAILVATDPHQGRLYESLLLPQLFAGPAIISYIADRHRSDLRGMRRTCRQSQKPCSRRSSLENTHTLQPLTYVVACTSLYIFF